MRGVADPRQVLHLVDDVDAVGAGPDAAVDDHLPEVEAEHPQRHEREHGQQTARSKRSMRRARRCSWTARRDALATTACGASTTSDVDAHESATLTGASITATSRARLCAYCSSFCWSTCDAWPAGVAHRVDPVVEQEHVGRRHERRAPGTRSSASAAWRSLHAGAERRQRQQPDRRTTAPARRGWRSAPASPSRRPTSQSRRRRTSSATVTTTATFSDPQQPGVPPPSPISSADEVRDAEVGQQRALILTGSAARTRTARG